MAAQVGQNNPVQALLQSLAISNDPNAANHQRQQAYQLQEQFKANLAVCLPTAFSLLDHCAAAVRADSRQTAHMTVVSHFAFHTLEHVVQNKWNALDESHKGLLKASLTKLLTSGHPLLESQRLIREKLALVLSATATREWPQRWPQLITDLLSASRSHTAGLVTVSVLRNLAEEVRSFNPKLPAQRRKQLQKGLSNELSPIFSFVTQNMVSEFNKYKAAPSDAGSSSLVVHLECMSSFLDFAAAKYAFQPQFVPLLLEMVKVPALFQPVVDILRGLALRKRAKLEASMANSMLPVWALSVSMLTTFSQSNFCQQNGPDKQLSYVRRCLNLLQRLLTNWRDDVTATSPEMVNFRSRMLTTIGQLVAHPSMAIASSAMDVFVYLLRNTNSQIISQDIQQQLLGSLVKVVMERIVKQHYNPDSPYALQYADAADFDRFAGDFRSTMLTMTVRITYREPLVVLTMIGQRLTQVLNAAPASLPRTPQDVNERGYLTVHSMAYRLFESVSVVLETALREVPYDTYTKKPASPTLTATANILNTLLSYQTQEPLMVHRVATCLSYFTDLYKSTPSALPAALTRLFQLAVFNTPREKDVPLTDLSEDVFAARKRACSTLMIIGTRDSSALMGAFQSCVKQVLALVRANAVTEGEKLCLYEFLVAVSGSMPNYQQQHNFVVNILQDSLKVWESDEIKKWTSQPAAFSQLLMPDQKAGRMLLYGTLATFNAVLNRLPLTAEQQARQRMHALGTVLSEEQQKVQQQMQQTQHQQHPSAAILHSIIPGILRLCSMLHSLWSPEGRRRLPPQCQGVLQLSSVERKVYLGEKALKAERMSDPQNYIRTWINQIRDACYRLLSRGARAGVQFFSTFPPQALVPSIFSNVQHMEHMHLKMLIDRFLLPYTQHCPPQLFAAHLGPILRGLIVVIFTRLSTEWSTRIAMTKGQTATVSTAGIQKDASPGTVDVTDDILAEKALRDLTRSLADFLMMSMEVLEFSAESKRRAEAAALRSAGEELPDNMPAPSVSSFGLPRPGNGFESAFDDSDDVKSSADVAASATPSHGQLLVKFALSNVEVARPLLASLAGLISWPDSHCNVRAGHIALHVLPHAMTLPALTPMLCELARVSMQCLMALRPADLELADTNAHHIALLREMYTAKTAQTLHAGLQQLFLGVPGVSVDVLQSLEQELFDPETDRKKARRVFKSFCGSLIVGIASEFKTEKGAAIRNLPAHESVARLGRQVRDELPPWGSPPKPKGQQSPQYTLDFN